MSENSEFDELRRDCWDEAIKAFGTAALFERRAKIMRRKVRLPAFAGIAIPLIIGSVYLSFGKDFQYLSEFIMLAGALGVIQIAVSAWALVAKWDDGLAYALESSSANYELSHEFKKLGKNPPSDVTELRRQYEVLEARNQSRRDLDYKQHVSEKEKRRGLRAGLRQFKRKCAECDRVPKSMKVSNCPVCGNF